MYFRTQSNGLFALSLMAMLLLGIFIFFTQIDKYIDRQANQSVKSSAGSYLENWLTEVRKIQPNIAAHLSEGGHRIKNDTRFKYAVSRHGLLSFAFISPDDDIVFASLGFDPDRDISPEDLARVKEVFANRKTQVYLLHNDDHEDHSDHGIGLISTVQNWFAGNHDGFHDDDTDNHHSVASIYLPFETANGQVITVVHATFDVSYYQEALEKAFRKVSETAALGTFLIVIIPTAAFAFRTLQVMRADRKLLEMSKFDQLTGVINRNTVTDHLQELFFSDGNAADHGLLFIDVDHFKQVNDRFGHACGDQLLKHIADLLRANTNAESQIVGRYGGDEFVVIAKTTTLKDLRALYGRIMTAANEPFACGTTNCSTSLSIGAYLTNENDTIRSALHKVDLSVYAAKQRGRNQVIEYSDELEDLFSAGAEQKSA